MAIERPRAVFVEWVRTKVYCPLHGDTMRCYRSEPRLTRYRCTVVACRCTAKVVRTAPPPPPSGAIAG